MAELEKLPYGYTSFREIRNDKKLYIDKTDLVYRLAHGLKYNFLSRPRRFGKSILVDTLECYWRGERALFAGLKIERLEHQWEAWPVIRLDMSKCGESYANACKQLDRMFQSQERSADCYDDRLGYAFNARMCNLIEGVYRKSGKPVVLLVDEYDYVLQHTWGTPDYEACASLYRSMFVVIKAYGEQLKWVFLTGIARFNGVGLFSALNNLDNLSFSSDYADLCGITDEELRGVLWPALTERAATVGLTPQQLYEQYRCNFDGYRFAVGATRHLYNSFCLIAALCNREIEDPLASSGHTNFLRTFLDAGRLRIGDFDNAHIDRRSLESIDVVDGSPMLYFYLLGYLTIESLEGAYYTLTYPNDFVRATLYDIVLPALLLCDSAAIRTTQQAMVSYLRQGDVDAAMEDLRALVERAPFDNNDKLVYKHEAHYQLILQSIFGGCGVLAHLEYLTHRGRADVVVDLGAVVYVFELKMDDAKSGGLDAAEKQLLKRGYHRALQEHGRRVRAVALAFDHTGEGLAEWREVLL